MAACGLIDNREKTTAGGLPSKFPLSRHHFIVTGIRVGAAPILEV
jgi:hypothetical protein